MGNFSKSVRLWTLVLILPATACSSTRSPAGGSDVERLALTASFRPGPPLSPGVGFELKPAPEASGAVVRVVSVPWASMIDPGGDPLDLITRFVAAPARAKPWLATSDRLARWNRLSPEAAPPSESMDSLELAFPVGSTAMVPLPAGFGTSTLRLGARSSRELEVALALGDPSDPHVALLEVHPRTDGEALLLLHTPAPEPGADAPTSRWLLEIRAVPVAELEDGYAGLAAASEQLASTGVRTSTLNREQQALDLALEAVRSGSANRPAVVHLARLLRAPFAADLALIATESELEGYIESAAENFRERFSDSPIEPASAALALERNAYRFALESVAAASNPAEDADSSQASSCANLLETHAGRASAFPEALGDLLGRATSLSSLERLLVDENRLWLGDNDPASRVVAFDWLARRNAAPAGFDPLASRTERRAALSAAAEAEAGGGVPTEPENAEETPENTGSEDTESNG